MNIFSNQSHVNSKEPPSQRWEASLSLQSPGKLDSESCLPESRCYQVCSLSSLSGTPLLPSGLPRVFPEGSQCVILPPSPKLTLSTTDLQVPGRIAYGKNEPRFILHVDGRALHGGRLQFCASLDVETWASTFSGSGKDRLPNYWKSSSSAQGILGKTRQNKPTSLLCILSLCTRSVTGW